MCKKECVICGKKFITNRNSAKTCSEECRKANKRRLDRERKKRKATIEKVCFHCGKTFVTHTEKQRFCCSSCGALSRTPSKGICADDVNIIVTEFLPVFEHMRPLVGVVYEGKKFRGVLCGDIYVIPSFGKYGVIVRANECKEVG